MRLRATGSGAFSAWSKVAAEIAMNPDPLFVAVDVLTIAQLGRTGYRGELPILSRPLFQGLNGSVSVMAPWL